MREFTKVPKEFYSFDLHWVPEFKALKIYQQAKLNYVYSPMPVWIPPKQRTCIHAENYDVSFIGSRDLQREALLSKVLQAGVNLEIRGTGWSRNSSFSAANQLKHQSHWQTGVNQLKFLAKHGISPWVRKIQAKSLPKVSDSTFISFVKAQPNAEEYVQIIQESRITLGINRYPSFYYPFSHPNTYSRMRDIEAPMMGACYLTEWTEGLEHLYELGKEIETYRTPEEMIEKIKMLNSDSWKRKKIRCQGQSKALTEHNILKSLEKISVFLGLGK